MKLLPSIVLLCLGLCAALAGRLAAFPPSPHYTIYGMIRTQVGATLRVQGATVVVLRDGAEIGRAPVNPDTAVDFNYEVDLRLDQARPLTRTYTAKAVAPQGVYSLYLEMNGEKFYPIEVAGTLRAGNGGERVRLDLTLGADTDRDGLPDVWEEWQLYQAGRLPGAGGWDLSLITRDGDFDGDGTSNYAEYVAGTFAGDATERFDLRLTAKTATGVAFEFFAITGKVYAIEESADLANWSPVPFAETPGGATTTLFRAPTVRLQAAHVVAPPGVARFYRLVVR